MIAGTQVMDRLIRFASKSRVFICLGAGLFLAGCVSASHNYLIKQGELDLREGVIKAELQLELDDAGFLSVSAHPDPATREEMARSISAVNQSAQAPPGAGAGEMAAAYVIGVMLVKASADAEMQNNANQKAAELFRQLEKKEEKEHLRALMQQRFMAMKTIQYEAPGSDAECCENIAKIHPQVQLSNNLRQLEVKLDFELFDRNDLEPVYKNTFIYLTDPAPSNNSAGYWADNDAEQFFVSMNAALGELADMIDNEFTSAAMRSKNEKIATIRYRNEAGVFYERGSVLRANGQRVVLRDLRGNVRSFSGNLIGEDGTREN